MKTLRLTVPLALATLLLPGCSMMGEVLVAIPSALLESALDDDDRKDAVRSHLRHGDTVEEAEKAASDDWFFQEMSRME